MYKGSNYKEVKWKETAEFLCLNKEDVIKKWKSLRDPFVRQKNMTSKSGDGLSQCKPKVEVLRHHVLHLYYIT